MNPPATARPVGAAAGRELVLVLPRSVALAKGGWYGLRLGGVREVLEQIPLFGEFRPRAEVENDPGWQQVIPHLVVRSGGRVLAMRRLRAGSERRLHGQVTLGVGGHVNAGDGPLETAFIAGCRREWQEEVVCPTPLVGQMVGLLKDDAGAVGRVHLGVLILVDAGTAPVAVREREKLEGRMADLDELRVAYLEMETWSQFVFDQLLAGAPVAEEPPLLVDLPPSAPIPELPAPGPPPALDAVVPEFPEAIDSLP